MKRLAAGGLDWYLLLCSLLLTGIGVSVIYSIAVTRGAMGLVSGQLVALGAGIAAGIVATLYDYRRLRPVLVPAYLVSVALLVAVHFFGDQVLGARRWISFGFVQLQPSELMKLALVGVVGRVLADAARIRLTTLAGVALLLGLPMGVVLLQPDLGTAGVLAGTVVLTLAAARVPRRYWLTLFAVLAVAAPLLIANLRPYQRSRIETFLEPTRDPYGDGYNVLQSLIAVGNGGMFGQGIGHGTQSQLEFLPVAHTDFIFAGIAEATGFAGSALVILLLASLSIRAFLIGRRSPDRFGTFVAVGIGSLWLVEFGVNVAMNIGLAPVTGIPLPFVSHGGSALVVNCMALGLLQSIALRTHARSLRRAD